MLILITNDDSIHAPGLMTLVDCATGFGDVIVVAPDAPQSGQSSALSVNKPLRIKRLPDRGTAQLYTVSGTPVDCVKLALNAIVPRKPDLLLSGINHGSNSGNAITYSGTMGAVLEGTTVGIPSVGFSLLHHSIKADFSLSASYVTRLIGLVIKNPLPDHTALNINIPARIVPHGVRTCRAARGHWSEEYQRYIDPSGNPFYWLTGRFVNDEPTATDTDEYWLGQGYISLVPVTPDQTAATVIPAMTTIYNI